MPEPLASLASEDHPKRGHYIGTEVDGKWWRRYGHGWLARGTGRWWLDGRGLYFRRYLTKTPLFIPFAAMTRVRLGTWHAGQWQPKVSAVKIDWQNEGLQLSSGFTFSSRQGENPRVAATLPFKAKTLIFRCGP